MSGRLYESNVLLYDHQTESLWSQLMETAVAGPMAGAELQKMPAHRTAWEQWREAHPQTAVLSTDTGYARDYDVDPYEGYDRALGTMFPVGDVRTDLPSKAMVLGVKIEGRAKAYPLARLKETKRPLEDTLGGSALRIEVATEGQVVAVQDDRGRAIPVVFAYWFAWQAFHPRTAVCAGGD